MMSQISSGQPAPARQAVGIFLLVIGAGLVFINYWVRQDFEFLLQSQESGSLASLLLPVLTVGLSPFSLLFGAALFLAALWRYTDPAEAAAPWMADQPGASTTPERSSLDQYPTVVEVQPSPKDGVGRFSLMTLSAWLGVTLHQVAFLGLGLLFALSAGLAAGGRDYMRLPHVAVLAWVLAIALAVLGGWRSEEKRPPVTRRMLLIALGLATFSFSVRFYQVERIPLVLSGDEASMGLSASRFLQGETDNIFAVGWFSHPALFFYIQSKFIGLFGRTILALRLPSVLVGALTVGGVYVFGRALFGGRTGLYAALFLAFLHYQIHFSRLGLNNIWDGLMFVVTLGSLWQGWRKGGRVWFLLTGLSLGLAQFFYVSSRLLLALVPLWLLAAGLVDRVRLRRHLPDLLLMGVTALVTVLPLVFFFSAHPGDYLWPLRQATVLSAEVRPPGAATGLTGWLVRLGEGFLAYTHVPLRFVWYTPGTPILRALPGTLFILGVLALVFRLRDPRTWLLAGWLAVIGLAGGLSDYTPAAQRYVAAAPALALVAGFGLEAVFSRLQGLWPQQIRLLSLGVVLLFLMVGIDELHFYFFSYAPYSTLGGREAQAAQRLGEALQSESAASQVVFFGGERLRFDSLQSVRYLAPDIRGLDMPAPWGSPANPQPEGKRLLFVFLPETVDDLVSVEASYPGGCLTVQRDAAGEVLYRLYAYPAADPCALAGSEKD